ncbi:MAG: NAD(+) diphosphatase [Desulfatiglandales bacterium]
MRFEPGISPSSLRSPAWWFFFRGNRLLIKAESRTAGVPLLEEPEALHLGPVRKQYLGTLDGVPCFSAECPLQAEAPEGMRFQGLRQLFGVLETTFFQVAGRAIQIMKWDQKNQYCGRCGAPVRPIPQERAKVCPECGLKAFPRLSPAVIAAVVRDERILLARANRFPVHMYSVLAGFVEPGETLEECLRREVKEEVGLEIGDIRYFGSQPWPFPDSLMIAFTARYAGGEIVIDHNEIAEAGWYSPHRLPPVPDKISIARKLIDWFVDTYR